jgi:hypothetical protein
MVDTINNFGYGTLSNSPGTSGTSVVLEAGQGANFPSTDFNCSMWPANTLPIAGVTEIVRCTLRSSDTFTITRAQEGTTEVDAVSGYQFAQTITAALLAEIVASGVTEFNTRTGAVTLEAADVEGLFTAASQIFFGTGSNTGELIALLSAIESQFTAAGQIFYGTGDGTGELVSLESVAPSFPVASGTETAIGTANTWQTIATITPTGTTLYTVQAYALIPSGGATLGVQVTFADGTGAETLTILPPQSQAAGPWSSLGAIVVAHSGTAVNVQVQSSSTSTLASAFIGEA